MSERSAPRDVAASVAHAFLRPLTGPGNRTILVGDVVDHTIGRCEGTFDGRASTRVGVIHGPEPRMERSVRKAASILGLIIGLYLVVRAIAEPFAIDMTNPATYRNDWGGPTLLGVLLVHCGPGAICAIPIARTLLRRGGRSSSR